MGGLITGIGELTGALNAPNAGTPDPNQVGDQYTSLLNALVSGMPQQLSAQQQYQPQFTQLSIDNLNQLIPALTSMTTSANTATRGANVSDLNSMGSGAADAIRGIDPGTSDLSDLLTKTATSQLNAGTALDPTSMNSILNGTLGAYSARGLGTSPAAQLATSTNLAAGGQNLLAQRESAASGVINQNMNNYTNPVLSMMGVNSPSVGAGMGYTAGGATGATTLPTNTLADMFGMAYNAQAASNIDNANMQEATMQSGISGVSSY